MRRAAMNAAEFGQKPVYLGPSRVTIGDGLSLLREADRSRFYSFCASIKMPLSISFV